MSAHDDRAHAPSAAALAEAVRELGVQADVEARERLAVLVVASDDVALLAADAMRRQAVALAKREGFTHIALEIQPTARAPLSRD